MNEADQIRVYEAIEVDVRRQFSASKEGWRSWTEAKVSRDPYVYAGIWMALNDDLKYTFQTCLVSPFENQPLTFRFCNKNWFKEPIKTLVNDAGFKAGFKIGARLRKDMKAFM